MKFLFLILMCSNLYAGVLSKYKIYSNFSAQIENRLTLLNLDIERKSLNEIEIFTELDEQTLSKYIVYPHLYLSKVEGAPLRSLENYGMDGYFDANEMLEAILQLENDFPTMAKVVDLNKSFNIPKTAGGNSLYALHISNTPGLLNDKAKILMIGEHHARELMTHHAVYDSAKSLLSKFAKDRFNAVKTLSKVSFWFVPVANPDGLNYVFTQNNWWRKNRTNNLNGTFGVDINRNYNFEWGMCGSNSSSGSSEVYKGPSAGSESEVKILDALNNLLKAQYVISFHSSGDEVLYPYVCHAKQKITDQSVIFDTKDRLANVLNFGKRYASSSGEDFEHHFNKHGSLAFLLEIGSEFQPAFSIYENKVRPNILKVIPFLERELENSFLEVKVISKLTQKPIPSASVTISELPLLQNETRVTDYFGTLRRKVVIPNVTVNVSRAGYQSKTQSIQLKSVGNTRIVIELD